MSLLIRFSLPTLLGNLLHQVYSITDSIIVGRRLGETALGAVGCTMPVIMLIASLLVGVNMGVGILLSQYFGRGGREKMRRVFSNSLYFGLAVSAAIAVMGPVLSRRLLIWMGTPSGPLEQATAYLRINFLTTVCPMAYYLFNCAFRGMGDSKTPLYCLILSVVMNVGLDILMVIGLDMGVAGSAWATALSQAGSAVFAAVLLWRKYPEMRLTRVDLRPDPRLFGDITRLAAPIAAQNAFNNLGNVVAQSGVNVFADSAMAAYTAGGRIGALALMPLETVGGSLSIYAGQNHGAGKPERIREGVNAALKLSALLSLFLGVVLALGGRWLAGFFLEAPSQAVLDISFSYLLITAVPGVFAGIMFVYQQVLRGIGKPNHAMVGGLMQLSAKILVVVLGAWVFRSLNIVWLAWPASFVAGTVVPMMVYYKKER